MSAPADERGSGLAADIERIEALRAAGNVTDEEAERLIEVLREVAEAEADIDSVTASADERNEPAAEPGPPPPPSAAPQPAPPPPRAAPQPAPPPPRAGGGVEKWLRVEVVAGDVRVDVDDVSEPQLAGDTSNLVLEAHGGGWRLRRARGTWFDRIQPSGVEVRIPRSCGVDLDVKAGEVRLRGVKAVRGKMVAGDLSVDGAEGIDLHKAAGDLDARLRLSSGRHRISASAGDVDVTLLEGSDVTVKASVIIGDARGPKGFQNTREGMGAGVQGTIGAGTARLDVRLSAGDVRIDSDVARG